MADTEEPARPCCPIDKKACNPSPPDGQVCVPKLPPWWHRNLKETR